MTVKIDPAGRVILPKPVRDRLGLHAGAELELSEAAGKLLLEPVEQRPSLIREGRLLVHTGETTPGFDGNRGVELVREERIAHIFGRR